MIVADVRALSQPTSGFGSLGRPYSGSADVAGAATTTTTTASENGAATETKAGDGADLLSAQQKELTRLKTECDELKTSLAYALADRENVRKILQRDVKEAKEFGVREFAKNLLDVSDNFERALSSVKASAEQPDSSAELRTFYEGVKMTDDQVTAM